MINFGFSYVGLIYLAMLFIPNIIWAKNKPEGYEEYAKNENRILLFLERAGEVLVSCLILITKDTNIRPGSWWIGWLIASFLCMVLYEFYWLKYFRSNKTMADMYSSFAGFPVAGATLPVIAMFLLGIYASNIFIVISSLILGTGHIGIHLAHRSEAGYEPPKKTGTRVLVGMLQIVIAIPLIIVTATSIFYIAKRNYNYLSNFINPFKGVDEQTYVDINGMKQFITIRGKSKDNPVILYLHGGPLSPDSYVSYLFSNDLIDDYTFVCWDQRGCGRTYVANDDKSNATVSFEQALDDVDVLTDYLLDRFGQDKIIIIGHSYGSILGATYVYDHPEKVAAYIGVGQFVNDRLSTTSEYEDALAIAEAAGEDTTAMKEAYEKYLIDPSYENSNEVSNLAMQYHPYPDFSQVILGALESPYLGTDDLLWYTATMSEEEVMNLQGKLVDTCLNADLTAQTSYEVPVYFISGSDDWSCSHEVMIEYAEMIGADYILIPGGNHNVQGDHPHEFAADVKAYLKSLSL